MILILGVTASGKGKLAFELAKQLDGEIISVDSMKVYRRMDIGTAKPPAERRAQIPHHLVDVVEPSESFSVDRYLELAEQAEKDILSRGKTPIAVGGTAMYIKTMLYGLFEGPGTDEAIRDKLRAEMEEIGKGKMHARLGEVDSEAAERIHPNDKKRIIRALEVYELTGKPISSFQTQFESGSIRPDCTVIGLRREKDIESRRINARVKRMIDEGLVDEVRGLLGEDEPLSKQAAVAIGYAEMIEHLQGEMSLDEAVEKIKINTRRFAKSQRTWFKTFREVQWIDIAENEGIDSVLQRALEIVRR
ncbi:tRNA dimethylallyltransferase [Anaerohalosphaera lusitana]|uniref:tRNA dimethylallyltransferase n=1 Tax=Anaerohalosphaera lusitana TaxID=1936003 RepID=A0A1U9NGE9_9BACT|nr:tRNA (adenosine(37)-N6)-dimethylallyltransferase MiaA [Anaerohalosphaera lusitana]AQT67011.1 tRNA dimethylallyltransferase [Anaerohalosphaera lusitana]